MSNNESKSIVLAVNNELNRQIADPAVMKTLVATVFKGFRDERTVKQACFEAMMRGYTFQDILRKKIYAIPFKESYSLVQSISDVRSIAMSNGHVGTSAPIYDDDESGKVKTCTITVKRKVGEYIGDYTATVYFEEYYKMGNTYNGKYTPTMWDTKPRTMIAKVAEMHALRKAFPEKLSESYVEEEFDNESIMPRFNEAKQEAEGMKMSNLLRQPHEKDDQNQAEADPAESNQEPARE